MKADPHNSFQPQNSDGELLDIVPALLFSLADSDGLDVGDDPPCAKGSVWELEEVDGRFKAGRYLPQPA